MAQTNRQPTTSRKSTGTPPMNPGDEAPRGTVGTGENCNGTGKIIAGIGGA